MAMTTSWIRVTVLLILILFCPFSGGNGQIFSLEQLVREADLIVRGNVQQMRSQESATLVMLSVEEQWKRPRAYSITIIRPVGMTERITG